MNCQFCNPHMEKIVMKNDLCYAMWDQFPVNNGHLLIIPFRHTENYFTLTFDEKSAILMIIDKSKEIIDKKFKPAGYNIADAKEIKEAADRKKRNVFVALNRRFYSATQVVREELSSINDNFRFIKVQEQQDQKVALASGQPKDVVDYWMYANSIHLIDYFRILGRGKVIKVDRIIPWNPKHPGIVIALLS